ncbi:Uma2 family endonuclease [Cohnella luojiensis]|uniref:Uma2 family endonuclease n=1 Tax=Cohnella luojiensis TaxID=652876 RepID=A0A4Y8M3K5_9BACL|nr:Uma2 family endonuclease [Cohnella luojiensis]TFE26724.1 Uma2 family endonuclease [Cohnella luojiensis]
MKKRDEQPIIREQTFTYDDYAQMPDDGCRYELADGVLELMSPAPTPKHQVISNQMQTLLTNSCQLEYIVFASPIDLILSAKEVRQPDLVMVHRSRKEIITRRGIEGIPDMVAEILSPHSVKRDKQKKLKIYAAYHIPEYWIIDPGNEALEQYVLSENRYELLNIYDREEPVQSNRISCVSFTMGQIVDAAADIPG